MIITTIQNRTDLLNYLCQMIVQVPPNMWQYEALTEKYILENLKRLGF